MAVTRFKPGGSKPAGINQSNLTDTNQIQQFNNKQIYTKGFTFGAVAGNANSFTPQLGGSPRLLHGIVFLTPSANVNDDDTFSLTINQELIVDKCNVKIYNPQTNLYKPDQFYPLMRSLSGADTVQINYTSIGSHNIFFIFYLSNA